MKKTLGAALLACVASAALAGCAPAATTTTTAAPPPASSQAATTPTAQPSAPASSASSATSAPAQTTTVAPAPAPSTQTATKTVTASDSAPAAPTVVDKEKYKITSAPSGFGYFFVTPSGSIRCGLGVGNTMNTVTCGVMAPVPGIADCPGEEKKFPYAAIGQGGEKRRGCTIESGEVRNTKKPSQTLNYGETLTVGQVSCTVQESGVTCTDSKFNGKLVVSKESITVS